MQAVFIVDALLGDGGGGDGFWVEGFVVFVVCPEGFVVCDGGVEGFAGCEGAFEEGALFGYGGVAEEEGAPVNVVAALTVLSSLIAWLVMLDRFQLSERSCLRSCWPQFVPIELTFLQSSPQSKVLLFIVGSEERGEALPN